MLVVYHCLSHGNAAVTSGSVLTSVQEPMQEGSVRKTERHTTLEQERLLVLAPRVYVCVCPEGINSCLQSFAQWCALCAMRDHNTAVHDVYEYV